MESKLQKMMDWFDSEEGIKALNDFKEDMDRKNRIFNYQLEKFHNRHSNDLGDFIQKVVDKYESPEYRERWLSRSIEPEEFLYSFLYEYASMYGRECTLDEYYQYGNEFTGGLYYHKGWYFNLMNGQGSVIHIIKED